MLKLVVYLAICVQMKIFVNKKFVNRWKVIKSFESDVKNWQSNYKYKFYIDKIIKDLNINISIACI